MFSSELDRIQYPMPARSRGMVLGTLILLTVTIALVSARTVPFLFGLTIVGFLVTAVVRGRLALLAPRRDAVFWHLAVFLLYAAVSTSWGPAPGKALQVIFLATVFLYGALIMMAAFVAETRPNLLHMGEGLWMGFVIGLVYLLVETFTGQGAKIWLYNLIGFRPGDLAPEDYFSWSGTKLIAIARDDLTRNMAALTMFLWPAVLVMRGALASAWGKAIAVLTVIAAAAVVLLSTHESSKLAIVGSVAVFAIAYVAPRLAGRLSAFGWVLACLAFLPIVLLAHRLELHNATWLQDSARHRIIIWNYTAEHVLEAPWFGVGARTTYVMGPRLEVSNAPDEKFKRTLSTHSHSIYLQTWFELGLVGAALLTLLGLSILGAIRALAIGLQPYAYATFVAGALMASSSYGMWQTWFNAMFSFSAALLMLGAVMITGRRN